MKLNAVAGSDNDLTIVCIHLILVDGYTSCAKLTTGFRGNFRGRKTCVCVRARVRARVRVCVCVSLPRKRLKYLFHIYIFQMFATLLIRFFVYGNIYFGVPCLLPVIDSAFHILWERALTVWVSDILKP